MSGDSIVKRFFEVSDEVESLLPRFNNTNLIIFIRVLPLNITARLVEHKRYLVREVAFADGQHETVFREFGWVILILSNDLILKIELLYLLDDVYLLNYHMCTVLDRLTEHVTSKDSVWLIDPENFKSDLLGIREGFELYLVDFDVESLVRHILLHILDQTLSQLGFTNGSLELGELRILAVLDLDESTASDYKLFF